MKYILAILITAFIAPAIYAVATVPGNYYVSSQGLNVRLAAGGDGKLVNTLPQNETVVVFEVQNGWARISEYFNGQAEGISGDVAHWVFARFLTASELQKNKQPPSDTSQENETSNPTKERKLSDPSPMDEAANLQSLISAAIESSDDFSKYKNAFILASEKLIKEGNCTLKEFEEMGGWWRSSNYIPEPVYFMYCGGMDQSNRVFLNTEKNIIFK
ncbi:SH3 domain-containing protein [Marinomonas sp. 15G1-11]|uniref:SH3 domain-containing protein n=1 Tax=Marinomonas phaeophyticola TaxID=3004091 RepID=A0ABT4JZA2_9GAMM|nr:SH3 domain-containing protein [Marinomonas sp. 15G1-11]MCZ2723713.1 SH3 domain-containing protein [Marinomonas sp. 15G1-11]